MIRHQAVREKAHAVAARDKLGDLEEALAVDRSSEDRPPLVAARDHVIDAVLDLDAWES